MKIKTTIKAILVTIVFLLAFSACLGELEFYQQIHVDRLAVDIQPWDDGVYLDPCFAESIEPYMIELKDMLGWEYPHTRLFVVLAHNENPKAAGMYSPPDHIYMIDSWHTLGVFGHELVRFMCKNTGECIWYQNSHDWSGTIGLWWNEAETLAVKYCGPAGPRG